MVCCEHIGSCKFFEQTLSGSPEPIRQGYQRQYCRDGALTCARRVVAQMLGRERVPVDLGPHESARAVLLLRSLGHKDAAVLFQ